MLNSSPFGKEEPRQSRISFSEVTLCVHWILWLWLMSKAISAVHCIVANEGLSIQWIVVTRSPSWPPCRTAIIGWKLCFGGIRARIRHMVADLMASDTAIRTRELLFIRLMSFFIVKCISLYLSTVTKYSVLLIHCARSSHEIGSVIDLNNNLTVLFCMYWTGVSACESLGPPKFHSRSLSTCHLFSSWQPIEFLNSSQENCSNY